MGDAAGTCELRTLERPCLENSDRRQGTAVVVDMDTE